MLRVIAGTARSLLLKTPEGLDTRPTTDRIKETLFNIIQNEILQSTVIDFFAGSGALGIEALSRGAKKAYFVDNGKEAISCIKENVKHVHFEDKSTILSADALSVLHQIHENHVDVIFMDPPYNKNLERELLIKLCDQSFVDPNTLIIIEADINADFAYLDDLGYSLYREKKYKTNKHVFIHKD